MLRHRISLERQINERLYQFLVPYDAPLQEICAILDDLKLDVQNRIAEAEKKQKDSELEKAS